jgi:hypothetical protein
MWRGFAVLLILLVAQLAVFDVSHAAGFAVTVVGIEVDGNAKESVSDVSVIFP